jgi:4-cresol dehydrogenase (hydroxylating)
MMRLVDRPLKRIEGDGDFDLLPVIKEWSDEIGADHVICDSTVLAQWETATYETSQRVLALIRPGNVEQVATCIRIANRYKAPIYPVSRGRNWGLGSRVPASDAVVIDLARLDRILAMDERFGCITLEPGVTFEQVHAYLTERSSQWFLPVIGGPADASVIGNCVERGDGIGPQCDRLSNMCSLEVVLADGSVVHTGFERFGETPLSTLSSMPAGAYLDGLFTQSNLGVLTRATLWLARRPKHLQLISAHIPEAGLAAFVDSLQRLIRDLGNSACTFSLWNGHKLNAKKNAAERGHSPGAWYCNGCLYAPTAFMAEAQRELALQALQDVSTLLEVFDQESAPDLLERLGLFLGKPNNDNVRSLYTEKPTTLSDGDLDPDRDRCGAMWICPEIPFDGATVADIIGSCDKILQSSGYVSVVGMSALTARTLRVFVSIFYDRNEPGEDDRAMGCNDRLQDVLFAAGMFPFRLGIHSMHTANQATGACWDLIWQIKDSLDPNQILAPGRYCRMDTNAQAAKR